MTWADPIALRLGPCRVLLHPRAALACGCLLLAVITLGLCLLATGKIPLGLSQIWAGLSGATEGAPETRVIRAIRLPRLLVGALAGAALAVSGQVFQSLSRNALGSPDVIGLTSAAASGALVQIILFNAGSLQTALAALLAGLASAMLVILMSRRGQARGAGQRLILTGLGVGALLSGLNTLLIVMGDLESAMSAQIWLAGSLSARNWSHVGILAGGIACCLPIILGLTRAMRLAEMGDDMAQALGVDVARLRIWLTLAAVGLASSATATVGPIAFIALSAPQIARKMIGPKAAGIIPSALTGMVLLQVADLLGQSAPFGLNLPIGLTTGFIGGLYMLVLISRR